MKKIATISILLFIIAQAVPAFCSFKENISLFSGEEKTGLKDEWKEAIDCSTIKNATVNWLISSRISTAFHLSEKKYISPYLEKEVPPPDFA